MAIDKDVWRELVTVRDLLRYAVTRFRGSGIAFGQGTSTAMDEAAFCILELLHLPVDDVNPWLDARLLERERDTIIDFIERRITTRKPSAYLLKKTYVQGIPFFVDERVIIPRSFIGELMSDEIFAELVPEPERVTRVLDLCTGSGCLAILAALNFPSARIDAVDVSGDALEVARTNVEEHNLSSRINLLKGDLFDPLKRQRYDLIITNPPYVDQEGMDSLPAEFRHEPRLALAGGRDGLDIIRRILAAAPNYLVSNGALLCEIGRCRPQVERDYSDLDFLWLDTEESSGEVFWITREGLTR